MPFTANQSYSAYIPLSNATSATISGSVPSGISATVDIPGQKVVISGIPTVPGQVFNFTITATNDCNPNYSTSTTAVGTYAGFVITPPPPPPPPLPPGCIIFNSLYPPAGQPEVYKKSHSRYTAFLNTYGVWESNTYGPSFDRTYTFYVPISETYKIICSCDNIGYVYIDGAEVLQAPGFGADYSIDISLSIGNHTIRTYGINSGGEASMATVVTRQSNTGCSAYPSFSSPVIDTGPTVPDATGGGGGDGGGGFESSGGGGECFIADTLITMHDHSTKRIDQIQIGDLVLDALTKQFNKVIGIKVTEYESGRRIFSTDSKVKPFITEQHAFYNENNELCAISEECEYLAPWLGPIKIVDVPNIEVITESITVYNLMFESGNSFYANSVPVNNMVGHGGTYVLYQKGFIKEEDYLGYIYHLENTVGLNNLTAEQKATVFKIVFSATKYILLNNNLRSWVLAKIMSLAIKNRSRLYPYLESYLKSKFRERVVKKIIARIK